MGIPPSLLRDFASSGDDSCWLFLLKISPVFENSLFKFSENLIFSAIATFSLAAGVRSVSLSEIGGDGKGVLCSRKS